MCVLMRDKVSNFQINNIRRRSHEPRAIRFQKKIKIIHVGRKTESRNGFFSTLAYRLLTAWLSFGKLCFSSAALVGVFCVELNGFTFCAILRQCNNVSGSLSGLKKNPEESHRRSETGKVPRGAKKETLRLADHNSAMEIWTRVTARFENIERQNSCCCAGVAARRAYFVDLSVYTLSLIVARLSIAYFSFREDFLNHESRWYREKERKSENRVFVPSEPTSCTTASRCFSSDR